MTSKTKYFYKDRYGRVRQKTLSCPIESVAEWVFEEEFYPYSPLDGDYDYSAMIDLSTDKKTWRRFLVSQRVTVTVEVEERNNLCSNVG